VGIEPDFHSNQESHRKKRRKADQDAIYYTRQEILAGEFANVLQELVVPQAILEWLGETVRSSDRMEQAARAETIKKLQARYEQIDARVGTM
jgi:hypothetical protein